MSNRPTLILDTGELQTSAVTGDVFYPQALRDQAGYFQIEVVDAPTSFTLEIEGRPDDTASFVSLLSIPNTNLSALGVTFGSLNWAPQAAGSAIDGSACFSVAVPMVPQIRLRLSAWSGTGQVRVWLVE